MPGVAVEVLRLCRDDAQRERVHLTRAFEPGQDLGAADDVPDPYFGGDAGFREVTDILERSCAGLLDHLEERG